MFIQFQVGRLTVSSRPFDAILATSIVALKCRVNLITYINQTIMCIKNDLQTLRRQQPTKTKKIKYLKHQSLSNL